MLAAFEYRPFLDESTVRDASSSISDKSISTTSAADIADLHSQLKQVRYAEALHFLKKYVGLKTRRSGAGIKFSASSDENKILSEYSTKMTQAKGRC